MAYVATNCLFLLLFHRRDSAGHGRAMIFWFFGRREARSEYIVEIGGTEERQTEISVKVPCKWVKWPNISPEMGISDKPSHESE